MPIQSSYFDHSQASMHDCAGAKLDSMKFQLGAVLCFTPVKCSAPQPQPQSPPCTIQADQERRRGNRRSQQRGRMDRSKSSLQSDWRPSLDSISEDNISLEVSGKTEGQFEAQEKLTKTSNSSSYKASVSTYAREIKQTSSFHMTIPTFVPSTFFF